MWISAVFFTVVGMAQAEQAEPRSSDSAGFFEVKTPGDGGLGTGLWLQPDGQWLRGLVVMLNGEYQYEDGTLVVWLQSGEERRSPISIEGDLMVGLTPPGVPTRRVGQAPLPGDIEGVWEYEHNSGEMAYERFLEDGRHQFRLPVLSSVRGGEYFTQGEEVRLVRARRPSQ